ncbi:hypothetical protein JHK86_018985 [Glycine max]|nr:hypothetical protein JHK86_018985 [Glycine max]
MASKSSADLTNTSSSFDSSTATSKDMIEVSSFYHRQWAPDYLELPNCAMPHVNACGRHMTILWRFGPPLQWNVVVVDGGVGRRYVVQPWYQFLADNNFSHGDETVEAILSDRGYGKRQQWKITMHDGVPSVAQPWFQYLSENNLMPRDDVIFFFRFDKHVWEVVFRKEVIWDDEDLSR